MGEAKALAHPLVLYGRTVPSDQAVGPAGPEAGDVVRAVARAFDVLQVLARTGEPTGLRELAAQCELALGTAHRLAATLTQLGYIRREGGRRYALGPQLIPLGEAAARQLTSWASPFLHTVAEETGENANLAVLQGDRAVYVAQVPSTHPVRMFTQVGRIVLPHCTAVGKAMLAELGEAEARRVLHRTGLPALTPRTITEPDELLADLRWVRKRGYATDDGEHEPEVRCIAVAIREPMLAAMSVSAPQARLPKSRHRKVAALLRAAATSLTASLSGAPE
jgi:IclR family acetate operon transcriptional repressor